MSQKNALRLKGRNVQAGAGLQTLLSEPVPVGRLWCIQRLAFEGSLATSGGNTRARTFIEGHGYRHYLDEQDAPVAGTLYWDTDAIWLNPSERLGIEWDQAQDTSVLEFYATGYYVDLAGGQNA